MSNDHPERLFEKAQLLTSAAALAQCPADDGREVAFAGRSNAGKSSALNALTRNSKLARTSKTPGRTRLLNFFSLCEQRRLVDLPGYGFAKVPTAVKQQWERQIDHYLRQRRSLTGLVLVMDSRHPLTDFDRMMLQWVRACDMPAHLLLTKADKLKKGAQQRQLRLVMDELGKQGGEVSAQLFSAQARTGVTELAVILAQWLDISTNRLTELPALRKKESPATQGRE